MPLFMTTPTKPRAKLFDWAWFLLFAVASSIYCVTSASRLSATFDEPSYVYEGLRHWHNGSYKQLMKWGTMPLPIDVETLPLNTVELIRGKPFENNNADFRLILPWARAMTLIFWWVLLAYAWLAARQLGGPWAARTALAAIACEPNLLAHAALATTDIAVGACLLAFTYHFARGRDAIWPQRRLIPGIWYGLSILAKASGMVFGGFCMIAVEIGRLIHSHASREQWKQAIRPFVRDAAVIVGIGMAITFFYVGSDWGPEPTFITWAQTLKPGITRTSMLWTSEHLRIFTNAGEGIAQQIKHNIRGHGAYLLGGIWKRSVWYYFPVTLSIKLTESLLLAPVILLLVNRRRLANWAVLAALMLLGFSLNSRVQIGVRMMLPLIVLACLGLSVAAVGAVADVKTQGRRIAGAALIAAALLWNAAASARVWPNAICYTNDLWGGTANGYLLLSDSNYDWGQGVPDLLNWNREYGGGTLDVWSFSTDPLVQLPPLHVLPLHTMTFADDRALVGFLQGRRLVASTTLVYGAYGDGSIQQVALYLRKCKPTGRSQTFLIYDFTGDASNPGR